MELYLAVQNLINLRSIKSIVELKNTIDNRKLCQVLLYFHLFSYFSLFRPLRLPKISTLLLQIKVLLHINFIIHCISLQLDNFFHLFRFQRLAHSLLQIIICNCSNLQKSKTFHFASPSTAIFELVSFFSALIIANKGRVCSFPTPNSGPVIRRMAQTRSPANTQRKNDTMAVHWWQENERNGSSFIGAMQIGS